MKIRGIRGRELLDSRGNPTVEAEVTISDGTTASALVPSGMSKGTREARELRDTSESRWSGKGVQRAVSNINGEIRNALVGSEADLSEVDGSLVRLDGTPDKSSLGANATLAVSLATARAVAAASKVPFYEFVNRLDGRHGYSIPTPMVNIISGGLHTDGTNEMQDFLVIPVGAADMSLALEWVGSIYRETRELLHGMGHSTLLADEGGFGPRLKSNEEALRVLEKGVSRAGLGLGKDVVLGVDVASSHFFRDGRYQLEGRSVGSSTMVKLYESWTSEYAVVSLEDGCAEDDWEGWAELTSSLGKRVQLIGDDLFTTNPKMIELGAERGVANSVLIKPNQIGTLSETLESMHVCRKVGYAPVVSARSGDTEDPFIADLAVGTSAGQIKIGSLARSERTAKYNQLLRLEERLKGKAPYAGRVPFPFLAS